MGLGDAYVAPDPSVIRLIEFGEYMDILLEKEIELHQYEIRQSLTEVERMIHPSFSEIGNSGISYGFASIIEMMSAEEPSDSFAKL